MCYDIVFKAVFMEEENILAKLVADVTGIDYYILEDNIILEVTELPISKMDEKAKRCDFVLRILDNMIINLELNSFKYNGLMIKNLSYLASIFAGSTKKKKKYNEDLIVMQLNLNCYEKNTDNALSQYQLQEVNTHKLYCKNISIFDLNVEKCNELYYNLDNKGDIPNYAR